MDFRVELQEAFASGEQAVVHLLEKYEGAIRRAARRKLYPGLRSQYESVDFLQMVFKSVVGNPERIQQMASPDLLLKYLLGMTRKKVLKVNRDHLDVASRDKRREQAYEDHLTPAEQSQTPSNVAVARDLLEQLLDLCTPREREILMLRIEGCKYTEIGKHLDIHEDTARAVIRKIRERAQRLLQES